MNPDDEGKKSRIVRVNFRGAVFHTPVEIDPDQDWSPYDDDHWVTPGQMIADD